MAPAFTASMAVAALAEVTVEPSAPPGVRCPACETTVMPVTGWCSYCMEPLPHDGSSNPADSLSEWTFEDSEDSEDVEDFDDFQSEEAGGQIIVGPWPDRPPAVAAPPADIPATDPAAGPTAATPLEELPIAVRYASWGRRAMATLIDSSVFVPALVALTFSPAFGLGLLLAATAFSAWQMCSLQGRTGQTWGKKWVGILLVQESTLGPIGTRRAALRLLAHGIDAALLGVGYLWPLWDPKCQTFADQLFTTVVLTA
jgi:uncharacterized RDD family membrane protein YckC